MWSISIGRASYSFLDARIRVGKVWGPRSLLTSSLGHNPGRSLTSSVVSPDRDDTSNWTSVSFTVYIVYIVFIKLHSSLCERVYPCVPQCTCGGRRKSCCRGSAFSFYHVGPEDWLQDLASKHLYWLSHLTHQRTYCVCVLFSKQPSYKTLPHRRKNGKVKRVTRPHAHFLSLVQVSTVIVLIITWSYKVLKAFHHRSPSSTESIPSGVQWINVCNYSRKVTALTGKLENREALPVLKHCSN